MSLDRHLRVAQGDDPLIYGPHRSGRAQLLDERPQLIGRLRLLLQQIYQPGGPHRLRGGRVVVPDGDLGPGLVQLVRSALFPRSVSATQQPCEAGLRRRPTIGNHRLDQGRTTRGRQRRQRLR